MSHGWFAALAFAGAFGFYLLLAGNLSWTELAAALAAAAAVAAFMTVQRLRQGRPVALAWPPARVLLGTVASLATDTVRVGLALLRTIPGPAAGGEASWQSFHPGGRKPRDAGRRALVTLLTSLAPNGFVLDLRPSALPEARRGLLLHRLVPAPPLRDRGLAVVTVWEMAVAALLPAFAIPVLAALRGGSGDRLAALQLGSSVFTIVLAVMTFAFDQSSFIDLALSVPLLTVPGTLAFTLFLGAVGVTAVVAVLLAVLVGLTWLGCLGFARLRTPLDRLHCAAFVNVAGGAALAAVAFAADGSSVRAWKVLVLVLAGVLGGAALSHAAGRALLYRERFRQPGPPA